MAQAGADQDDAPSRGGAKRASRPRAAGRAAIRAMVDRLSWVDAPIIYWTGRPAPAGPAAAAAMQRLAGLPAGPYAVRITIAPVAPDDPATDTGDPDRLARLGGRFTVADPVAITPALIARSNRRLAEVRRFPRLLPALVGDVQQWRARCDAAVLRARAILDAKGVADRARVAMILGASDAIPATSSSPAWPLDLWCESERRGVRDRLAQLGRTATAEVVEAVRCQLLLHPAGIKPFLDALPDLLALHQRLADEPMRRLRAAASIQRGAVVAAMSSAIVAGPVLLPSGPLDAAGFDGWTRRYDAAVADAVRRYHAAVLPLPESGAHALFWSSGGGRTGSLDDLLIGRRLREALLSPQVRTNPQRLTRSAFLDGQVVALGPDGQPLRYETLAATAQAALWSDVTAEPWPPRPLPASAVLDAAVAGAIPLAVPWAWVEACCQGWPIGDTALGPAMAVLASLAALRRLAPDASVAAGCLAVLDRLAGPLLARALGNLRAAYWPGLAYRYTDLEAGLTLLCRCLAAGLTQDEVTAFFDHRAADLLHDAVGEAAAQLAPFARRMRAYLDRWATEPDPDRAWPVKGRVSAVWSQAYVRLGSDLLDRFVREVGPAMPGAEAIELVRTVTTISARTPDDRLAAQRSLLAATVPLLVSRLAELGSSDAEARGKVVDRYTLAFSAADAAGLPDGGDARSLLAACFDGPNVGTGEFHWNRDHADRTTLAAIAMGRADRLLAIARLGWQWERGMTVPPVDVAHVTAAWGLLRGLGPSVTSAVSAAVGRDGLTGRAIAALARLGLCLRFHRHEDLRAALASVVSDGVPDPDPQVEQLAQLRRWRPGGDLPGRVRDAVDRPAELRRELNGILARGVDLPASAARRADHLRRQLADPAALARWVGRDLAKVLGPAVDEACVARLEAVAEGAIRGHFRDVLGISLPTGPSEAARRNWDNGLRLYLSVDRNRPRLRRLFEAAAAGAPGEVVDEAPAVAFRRAVTALGVDVTAWRGPFVRQFANLDGRPLRVELETDPLHVLQMGNYFGTCLSQGDINAFSTIANATDFNKRVAYAYDERGAVVGRKLLVMTSAGQIVGFRTYGVADKGEPDPADPNRARNHMKAVMDVFCRDLARCCRATLHPFSYDGDSPAGPPADAEMTLSAAWYNDGPEPFQNGGAGDGVGPVEG